MHDLTKFFAMAYNCGMDETANLIQIELPGVPADIARNALAVASDIVRGATLAASCRKHGLSIFDVLRWQRTYTQIEHLFTQAVEAWTHIKADELLELPDRGWNPAVARTHSDNIKWLVSRRNRRDYGDSTEPAAQVQGALVDALKEAINRIPRPMHDLTRTIDMQPIEITGDNQPMSSDE